jgi:hypothetical protein
MSLCVQGDAHLAPIRVQHKFEGAEEEFTVGFTVGQDVTATDEIVDSSTATDTSAATVSTGLNSSVLNSSSTVANSGGTNVSDGQWGWGQGVTAAKKQRNTNTNAGTLITCVLVCSCLKFHQVLTCV